MPEVDQKRLLELYPEYDSVLGPYFRKDGRKHIVLNNSKAKYKEVGKTKTISFPKALMEVHLGRKLLPDETVDHIDRDKTNDELSNLAVCSRSAHCRRDSLRVRVAEVPCAYCGILFTPSKSQRNKQSAEKIKVVAGPFCSKKCAGRYGQEVQMGRKRLGRTAIKKEYYREEKQ